MRLGFSWQGAGRTAAVVVEADLRGVHSHGVRLLGEHLPQIRRGTINPAATAELIRESGATALYDGHHGYGPDLCASVLDRLIDLGRTFGIGLVSIRNSSHWGCPAYYTRRIAHSGLIGIGMTNTSPAMPIWGSSAKSVGNNPLTIAAPRPGGEPIVLDMAMQVASWGKIALAARSEAKLPPGAGFDRSGHPTEDAQEILRSGRARPVGDYKGSGLAVMMEILTGIMAAGQSCFAVGRALAEGSHQHKTQTFIAIQVGVFASRDTYAKSLAAFCRETTHAPLAEGFSAIMLPGDRSNELLAERRQNGIPVTESMRVGIDRIAEASGVANPLRSLSNHPHEHGFDT
jgi:LDH2 family malate/lactate/ureidoglycolate dehydrogenase